MTFFQDNRTFKTRILIAVVAVILIELILLTYLFGLQVQDQESYRLMSEDNRLRHVPMSPARGLIYDRNGFALARNHTLYHLELTPILVEDMDATLQGLQEIIALSDEEVKSFKARLASHKPFRSLSLKPSISEENAAKFAVERHRFKGVDIVGRLNRIYPYREAFSHVIGYLGNPDYKDMQTINRSDRHNVRYFGKYGLEQTYEDSLRGEFGVRTVEVNAEGRILRTVSEEKPLAGEDIILTLDKKLQMTAYDALEGYEGAVVAIDPRNGNVLAMVSRPAFDSNQFVNGMSRTAYKKLLSNEQDIFFHRAITGQYSPGSTIKPLIALAGLQNQVTVQDYYMHAGPHYVVPGHERKFKDWRDEGHGWVNLRDSIAQSCDVFFYDLSYRLGIDKMSAFLQDFGLGQPTGIHINHEAAGLIPSRAWKSARYNQPWYPEETIITGIGQGYLLTTPIQLAMITATIANRGRQVQPRFVASSPQGASAEEAVMSDNELDIEPQHWAYVINGMVDAVHRPNGTAYSIGHSSPYTMAGKTGTVQIYRMSDDEDDDKVIEKRLRDHSLFIVFAPADEPTIAMAVVVEHVGSGSKYAAPIARRILDTHFNVVKTASIQH